MTIGHGIFGNFSGYDVHEVRPGTEIKNEVTGETATVTDTQTVFQGRRMYVTKTVLEALQARCTAA